MVAMAVVPMTEYCGVAGDRVVIAAVVDVAGSLTLFPPGDPHAVSTSSADAAMIFTPMPRA
jgi:hypothetical protein